MIVMIMMIMMTCPRYVGDMLAWIHQSCPGEAESIQHLLRQVDKVDRRELETRIMTGATEGVSADNVVTM